MIKQLSYEGLKTWEAQNIDFVLIDVREKEEREAFHIGGEWIPLAEVVKSPSQLPLGKNLVFYCRKGIRSQIAIQRLARKMDTSLCYNLAGGISHLKEKR